MAMRELLRIEMSAAQVKEACEAWAFERTALDAATTDGAVTLADGGAIVTFTKKRAPRVRKTAPRDAMAVGDSIKSALSDITLERVA